MIKKFKDVFSFSDEEINGAVKEGELLSVEVEFSSKCNLWCVYCYAGKDTFRSDELGVEEMQDVISQARALGAKKVVYLGAGEPLLDTKLKDVIKYVRRLKMEHILFTNATLIDRQTAQFFYDQHLTVVVKYSSMNREVYDRLAGCPGAFSAMRRGMDFLLEAGYPDKDHVLAVESILCKENFGEIQDIWKWARGKDILPYVECLTHMGKVNDREDLLLTKNEIKEVFEGLARLDAEEYGLYWKPHPPIAGFSCKRHLYSCTVTSQGFVLPCIGVDIKMGNIRDDKLTNILKNSPVRQQLLDIRKNIKGKCRTCEQSAVCYGCRGTAYHMTGDYLESDPTCWRAE